MEFLFSIQIPTAWFCLLLPLKMVVLPAPSALIVRTSVFAQIPPALAFPVVPLFVNCEFLIKPTLAVCVELLLSSILMPPVWFPATVILSIISTCPSYPPDACGFAVTCKP